VITYALFAAGIILLIKGADYLVDGASSVAKRFGVPTLVIGLTIVAFGTSTPELVVSIMAAINKTGDIAFGNVVGSNMANILLILGAAGIFTTLKVQHSTTWKEIPFSLLAALVLLSFSSVHILDGLVPSVYRFEGIILLLFFAIFIYYVVELARRNKAQMEDNKLIIKRRSLAASSLMILAGFLGLYLGGRWVVDGAVTIAENFGLSQLLISSTIVAIGTSLPELITAVVAAMKNDDDLAVGSVVGSNIFNVFWVLGASAIIYPITLPASAIVDLLFLLVATLLLFFFMFVGRKHELEKWQAGTLLLCYAAYIIFLIYRG
jgi:cation:H+ antiporter